MNELTNTEGLRTLVVGLASTGARGSRHLRVQVQNLNLSEGSKESKEQTTNFLPVILKL